MYDLKNLRFVLIGSNKAIAGKGCQVYDVVEQCPANVSVNLEAGTWQNLASNHPVSRRIGQDSVINASAGEICFAVDVSNIQHLVRMCNFCTVMYMAVDTSGVVCYPKNIPSLQSRASTDPNDLSAVA